jgi:hypothetical protein
MDSGIAQSIARALDGRRSQREPATQLLAAWQDLNRNFEGLVSALEETRRRLSRGHQIQGALGITEELDRWRGDEEFVKLRDDVAREQDSVKAILDRAERETVNVGVVGQTGSGKSTFLQRITNLPEDVIPPANGPKPTTAARSRFLHSRDLAEAEIKLLTWEELREKYIAPLHAEAGCPGEAPFTPGSFLDYGYRRRLETSRDRQDAETGISPQALLRRLIVAQDSFDSYGPLLGRGVRREPLEALRPYVAYPRDDADMQRPYHAVRDVLVRHRFVVDIENLVFVDLPGTGETGLEVDHQFLADLKSEVDVLLHILRPLAGRGRFGKADDEILDLADRVRMGRDRADFICMVINEDHKHNTSADADVVIENVWAEAEEYVRINGFNLVRGDASKQDKARDQILVPVLDHLAVKLAAMDQAVAKHAGEAAAKVAGDAATVVGRLAADVREWQVNVPLEDRELTKRSKDLRDRIARELKELSERYARRAAAKEPVPEVEESLAEARRRLSDWASAKFGAIGGTAWVEDFKNKLAADAGEYKDDACTEVRQKLRYEFGRVDSSLIAARRRVHGEIAGILRRYLGTTLVPGDDESFSALLDATSEAGMGRLHSALAELVAFRTGYGSIFLRVGRPVVAQITRDRAEASKPLPLPSPPDELRQRLPTGQKSALFGGSRGSPSAHPAGTAAMLGVSQPHAAMAAAAFAAVIAAAAKVGEAIGPVVAEWLWSEPVTDLSAESFRKGLSHAFDRALELIAEQIRIEASELTEALAAIVDEFFDGFIHVPWIEEEYKQLCHPHANELWPGVFGTGADELSRRLERLGGAARQTANSARTAADAAHALGGAT